MRKQTNERNMLGEREEDRILRPRQSLDDLHIGETEEAMRPKNKPQTRRSCKSTACSCMLSYVTDWSSQCGSSALFALLFSLFFITSFIILVFAFFPAQPCHNKINKRSDLNKKKIPIENNKQQNLTNDSRVGQNVLGWIVSAMMTMIARTRIMAREDSTSIVKSLTTY